MAARKGHLEIVKFFLDRGFEVECRDSKGCSLFHLAATHNHKSIVDELIARNANIFSTSDDDLSIFYFAEETNMNAVMPALFEDVYHEEDRLRDAVSRHVADSVSFLLTNGAAADNHDTYDTCTLSLAILQSNWKICELLCNYGAMPHGSLPHCWRLCKVDRHEPKEKYPFVIQTVYHGQRAFHEMWDASNQCFNFLDHDRFNDGSLFRTSVGFNTLLCAAYHGDDGIAQGFFNRFSELERSVPDAMTR
ncbi:ankyrin repeat domain-containing protein [Aspergillus fijiensis CBS 313.89]|uniref:Ankyrin n=1 Tax=Aspergillus fijiensis CBS 313.89 TaxID=1448319 RepID=A0A8G1RIQ9_9EURO|nr:ankyrin [Aspergillus fijiensis CBS 313.89]RAK73137.1 ankyrin [Aspergillus fijiensis CBS 313.89]